LHDHDLMEKARQVLDACRAARLTLATAESCTGGMIAAALTDIAGSSDVVERGFVTYSNAAKSELLGIAPGWIAAYNTGPVRYEASLKGRPLPAETRAYVAIVAANLGGRADPGSAVITAAEPIAWTRAPLFIAQPDRTPSADSVPVERASNGAATTTAVRDVSAIVPQSAGLFVARATEGTMR